MDKRKLRPTNCEHCNSCPILFMNTFICYKLQPIHFRKYYTIHFYDSHLAIPRRHHNEMTIAVFQKLFNGLIKTKKSNEKNLEIKIISKLNIGGYIKLFILFCYWVKL